MSWLKKYGHQSDVTKRAGFLNWNNKSLNTLKVKVTLFNVGSSFSPDGTAINGSRRCALYPPCRCQCSILRVFKAIATRTRGKSKQTLKSLKIEPGTSRSESRALANWATTAPIKVKLTSIKSNFDKRRYCRPWRSTNLNKIAPRIVIVSIALQEIQWMLNTDSMWSQQWATSSMN